MPKISDFSQPRWEDCTISVSVEPPLPIGGWTIGFQVTRRFGGSSGLINKSVSSGLNGASGITVINSGQGMFNIALQAVNTSGLDFGPYAYTVQRLDSGNRVALVQGYFNILPNMLGA